MAGIVEKDVAYTQTRDNVVALIPDGAQRVLDVGCSVGAVGERIKARAMTEVIGIEVDSKMAEAARTRLDRVIIGDVENIDLGDYLEPEDLDCILFLDVLEHLRDPWRTVRETVRYLRQGGLVIASVPNVRHYTTIYSLFVNGRWPYRDRGIHDWNHLRFFCLRNTREMLEEAGLTICSVKRNYRLVERPHRLNRFSKWLAVPIVREMLTFQHLVVSTKKGIPGRLP
jgi:2-polyprenyl-3-methyl-5-hydroxy-6-metoxy-1,4-benzoquinol methylase